jgi:hypothetical protein
MDLWDVSWLKFNRKERKERRKNPEGESFYFFSAPSETRGADTPIRAWRETQTFAFPIKRYTSPI